MATGTVKWFSAEKGYGFISVEGGPDVYVHHTGIKMEGFRTLQEGAKVEFDTADDERRPGKSIALNVVPV
jgi:CspA family cold shock protein